MQPSSAVQPVKLLVLARDDLPMCERQSQCSYRNAQYFYKEHGFHRENPIKSYLSGQAHFRVVTVHFDSL
jgi:hypothetical protein